MLTLSLSCEALVMYLIMLVSEGMDAHFIPRLLYRTNSIFLKSESQICVRIPFFNLIYIALNMLYSFVFLGRFAST